MEAIKRLLRELRLSYAESKEQLKLGDETAAQRIREIGKRISQLKKTRVKVMRRSY